MITITNEDLSPRLYSSSWHMLFCVVIARLHALIWILFSPLFWLSLVPCSVLIEFWLYNEAIKLSITIISPKFPH